MIPKVSIIIPVYNNYEYVKVMLNSIVVQDYQVWELLLVDDGSDDCTLNLLSEYAKHDSRIKLFSRDRLPKGAQTCRNIGYKNAVGKYIIFFDSDDYIIPSCLSSRVKFMDSHPELDFCIFPGEEFFKQPGDGKKQYGTPTNKVDDLYFFLLPSLPYVVWNNIYRLEYLRSHNIFWDENIKSLQDSDYNIQNIIAGAKYDYVMAKPDYYYRKNTPNSIAKKIFSASHIKSHLYFYEKIIRTVQSHYGNKYDTVLKFRSLIFFKIIFSCDCDNKILLVNKLGVLLRRLEGGSFLFKNMKLYLNLNNRYSFFKKLPLSIFFPSYLFFKLKNKLG